MENAMKKKYLLHKILPLALGLVMTATSASAIDLYAFGSYWDQNDADDGVWGGGLGLSLSLFTDLLRLDGRVYGFEDSDVGLIGDKVTITPFDLGLQIHLLPNAAVDPYALGGVSYIYADGDRFDVDSSFGGYVGAGLDINLGIPLFKLFGEGIYRFSTLDRDLGGDLDMDGFTGNVGLKFHF
jgi:hypothetical protein